MKGRGRKGEREMTIGPADIPSGNAEQVSGRFKGYDLD